MATPIIRSSNGSAYALMLAYALILLSLWKVDMGLAGRPGFTAWGGDNPVARRFASAQTADESRPKSIIPSHQRSKVLTLLHQRGSEQNHRMKNAAD